MDFTNFERDLGMGGTGTFDPLERLSMDAMLCHIRFGDAARDFVAGLIGGTDVGEGLGNDRPLSPQTAAEKAVWEGLRDSYPGKSDGEILDITHPQE